MHRAADVWSQIKKSGGFKNSVFFSVRHCDEMHLLLKMIRSRFKTLCTLERSLLRGKV